jgi:hypothetical protein
MSVRRSSRSGNHGMFAADARSTQTTTSRHPPRASSSRILHIRGINQAVSLAIAHCGKCRIATQAGIGTAGPVSPNCVAQEQTPSLLSPKPWNHGLRLGSALWLARWSLSAKHHWPLTLYRLSPNLRLESGNWDGDAWKNGRYSAPAAPSPVLTRSPLPKLSQSAQY